MQGLQSCLAKLRAVRHELQTTAFSIAIVQGLAASGRLTEAFCLIDETIKLVSANGDHSFMPELLRVKGNLFLKLQKAECHDAAKFFKQSIDLSRVQCAPSWELRAAVDLANLLASEGRKAQGRKLLQTAFEQFEEGFETADLKVAALLLAELG